MRKILPLVIFVACAMFCKDSRFKKAHVGVCIVEIATGKEVYACNADQFFVPASLQKIAISAAALSVLGEDYRFKTELQYEGKIENGVLHGNVWIRGGGDPTLSLDTLVEWNKIIGKMGVRKIDGKILVDTSCYETALASPYWYFEDLGNYFGAGASALSVNQNTYKITFSSGDNVGDPAQVIKTEPVIPGLIVHNEVTTGPEGSGDRVYVFGTEYSPVQYYRGTVPLDKATITVKAAIPDPALFCGTCFSGKIPSEGIEVVRDCVESPKNVLSMKESPTLKEILNDMNRHSINLYAEHLLKTLGSGKAKDGALAVEKFLKQMDVSAQVRDGSGLARTNLITPKGFVALLCKIRKSPLYKTVYDSFPEPGGEGTLKSFPLVKGAKLRAKTGSMSNIGNLGGYITLASGKEYAFCLFCNNFDGPYRDIEKEMSRFINSFIETKLIEKEVKLIEKKKGKLYIPY